MQNINFDTGIKEYSINGDESKIIRFSTTDYGIIDRIKTAMQAISALEKKYKTAEQTDATDDAVNDMLVSVDKAIRDQINYIFDSDVCTMAFGNTNCLSDTKSGDPLFANFLNAIVPLIKKDMSSAVQNQGKLINKYTSKVHK